MIEKSLLNTRLRCLFCHQVIDLLRSSSHIDFVTVELGLSVRSRTRPWLAIAPPRSPIVVDGRYIGGLCGRSCTCTARRLAGDRRLRTFLPATTPPRPPGEPRPRPTLTDQRSVPASALPSLADWHHVPSRQALSEPDPKKRRAVPSRKAVHHRLPSRHGRTSPTMGDGWQLISSTLRPGPTS